MVSFYVYDISFLVLFSLFVIWFIRRNKKSIERQGIIFMYRTQLGVKAIKKFSDKFSGLLHSLKYVIIAVGVFLMGIMVWMLGKTLAIYILRPEITQFVKAPPIAPLIPYFPKLFGMESFFPPFYFTYFIVALAIVAIFHEFSHGIFMRLFKIKIKSTGLVFLGPLLGAFVEEDHKGFEKKSRIEQMTVLGAGVFANILIALIFYGLYVGFFFSSFSASGYIFNTYAITSIQANEISGFESEGNLTKVIAGNETFYLDENLAKQLESNYTQLVVYVDAPAFKAGMKGAIVEADGVKIENQDSLREFLEDKNPGDEVRFVTEASDGLEEYDLVLGEHPLDSSKAYVGVGSTQGQPDGVVSQILAKFMSFKDPSTYYKPTWNGEFVYFIFHLLWWVMIINLLVALFNMMPVGMLDGGRFLYLGVWIITGSKKFGKIIFRFASYAILLIFLLLMFFWFIRIV